MGLLDLYDGVYIVGGDPCVDATIPGILELLRLEMSNWWFEQNRCG